LHGPESNRESAIGDRGFTLLADDGMQGSTPRKFNSLFHPGHRGGFGVNPLQAVGRKTADGGVGIFVPNLQKDRERRFGIRPEQAQGIRRNPTHTGHRIVEVLEQRGKNYVQLFMNMAQGLGRLTPDAGLCILK
jgi:hypothetical protein